MQRRVLYMPHVSSFLDLKWFFFSHISTFFIYKYLIWIGLVKISQKMTQCVLLNCAFWSSAPNRELQQWSEQPHSTWPLLSQGELLLMRLSATRMQHGLKMEWERRKKKKKAGTQCSDVAGLCRIEPLTEWNICRPSCSRLSKKKAAEQAEGSWCSAHTETSTEPTLSAEVWLIR